MKTYLPNVMAAISAMSVPVGPQGSLLVAVEVSISHERLSLWNEHTISNLHLHTRITLGNVLDASHDFRHDCCCVVVLVENRLFQTNSLNANR